VPIAEAAALTGVPLRSIYNRISASRLPTRAGNGSTLVELEGFALLHPSVLVATSLRLPAPPPPARLLREAVDPTELVPPPPARLRPAAVQEPQPTPSPVSEPLSVPTPPDEADEPSARLPALPERMQRGEAGDPLTPRLALKRPRDYYSRAGSRRQTLQPGDH
jgi:hypothetical protein